MQRTMAEVAPTNFKKEERKYPIYIRLEYRLLIYLRASLWQICEKTLFPGTSAY